MIMVTYNTYLMLPWKLQSRRKPISETSERHSKDETRCKKQNKMDTLHLGQW